MPNLSYREAKTQLLATLKEITPAYQQDTNLVLEHILGQSLANIYQASPDDTYLTDRQNQELSRILAELGHGRPLAHVIGYTYFWGHQIQVTPSVLIPRPETEGLVELVLADIIKRDTVSILEVGTGSGCIAVALLTELRRTHPAVLCTYVGLEPSLAAYKLACENISSCLEISLTTEGSRTHLVKDNLRITIVNSAIEEFAMAHFIPDILVSNPPYITAAEFATLDASVKDHEPALALLGGTDGLQVYRSMINYVSTLNHKPSILWEISPAISSGVQSLLHTCGYANVYLHTDLFGRLRFAVAD